jgi:hypothetical protein
MGEGETQVLSGTTSWKKVLIMKEYYINEGEMN